MPLFSGRQLDDAVAIGIRRRNVGVLVANLFVVEPGAAAADQAAGFAIAVGESGAGEQGERCDALCQFSGGDLDCGQALGTLALLEGFGSRVRGLLRRGTAMTHRGRFGGEDFLGVVDLRVLQGFQSLRFFQRQIREQPQKAADVGIRRVAPELPVIIWADPVGVEPDGAIGGFSHLGAGGGGDQRRGETEDLRCIHPAGQFGTRLLGGKRRVGGLLVGDHRLVRSGAGDFRLLLYGSHRLVPLLCQHGIFAGDRVRAIMDRLKMPEGEPIEAGIVTRSIESAQRKVEGRNFDIRKQLLQYDDVSNDQRKELYKLRNEILEAQDVGDLVKNLRESVFTELFRTYVPAETMEEQWDVAGLEKTLREDWGVDQPLVKTLEDAQSIEDEDLLKMVLDAAEAVYEGKVAQVGRESFAGFERSVMLQSLDTHWREHLAALDMLRQGIHLRGYAQKDPKQEYKRESFELFGRLLDTIRNEVTRIVFTVRIQSQEELEQASEQIEEDLSALTNLQYKHDEFSELAEVAAGDAEIHGATPAMAAPRSAASAAAAALAGEVPKVGRNDPCPCGSGKKYKQCHGKLV